MANSPISGLPVASTLTGEEVVALDQGGTVTAQATLEKCLTEPVDGAVEKVTPADADLVALVDSADLNALKKLSFTNLATWVWSKLGALIAGGTGKTLPVGADTLVLSDSADTDAAKKLTFANLATWVWGTLGALIAGGVGKTTPVDADTFALSDSADINATKKLTWLAVKDTLKTYFDTVYAALAGSASQVFSVGNPTNAAHAVPADWVGYLISAPSASTVDIFGAAGATISIDNSTPVTATDFADCTVVQVGSVKRVIPVEAWTVTASANMTVDGIVSGDITIPADTRIDVLATATDTFTVTTDMPMAARGYATGTTSATSGYNLIALAGESFDTHNCFASSRFTARVAGWYSFDASGYFASASYEVAIQVRKNGTPIAVATTGVVGRCIGVGDVVYLAGGDYLELFGFSATTQNVSASDVGTFLSVHRVR